MKDKKVYKLEMDGEILKEEYDTVEQAMAAARKMFEADSSKREANVLKFVFENTSMSIRNK